MSTNTTLDVRDYAQARPEELEVIESLPDLEITDVIEETSTATTAVAEEEILPEEPEVTESLPDLETIDANDETSSATTAVLEEEILQVAKAAEADGIVEVTEELPTPTQDSPKKKKLCGVCNEKESKYKCTRCLLPFCSIVCSTIHKATHPAEEPKSAVELKAHPTLPAKPVSARPGTVAGANAASANSNNPFAALDDSEELQQLFKKYPRLKMLLEEIDKVTLPPVNGQQPQNGGRGKEQQWNSDRGLQKGVQSLNTLRNTGSKDGKAIREFSKLILRLLSPEQGLTAREVIEKELAEENQKIVEQLLNGER
ncbi:hypothetical protein WAI453_006121 [Rhynchosporium graminicola]